VHNFKDFNIKPSGHGFIGDRIKVERILNKEIIVHRYEIKDSIYEGKCLYLQVETGNEKRVIFTGSKTLMDMIAKVTEDKLPFTTTIVKDNDRFEFT